MLQAVDMLIFAIIIVFHLPVLMCYAPKSVLDAVYTLILAVINMLRLLELVWRAPVKANRAPVKANHRAGNSNPGGS